MRHLLWKKTVLPGEAWHFARTRCRARAPVREHRHDFAEVFWIEQGEGVHILNGRAEPAPRGTLVFMRPDDCHGLEVRRSGEAFTIANFALSWAGAEAYSRRWLALGMSRVPWNLKARSPVRRRLTDEQIGTLARLVGEFATDPTDALAGDRFLVSLVHELVRRPGGIAWRLEAPEWLVRAVEAFHEPQHLRGGREAFYRLAGRSREHVSRRCRTCTGMTLTELVDSIRVAYARRLLQRTELSVTEVAAAVGMPNLSRFHRRFRQATGLTPRRYRLSSRESLPMADGRS